MFSLVIGVIFLVLALQIVVEVVANITGLTGIAATIVSFLPAILGLLFLALLLRDAGFMKG